MNEQSTVAAWRGTSGLLRSTPRAYEAVAHELLVLILGGHLAVGDRLPSERQLASRFGVSRPTVREALGVLESRGLVVTRKGSGTFVAGREATDRRPTGRTRQRRGDHGDAPRPRGRGRPARGQACSIEP